MSSSVGTYIRSPYALFTSSWKSWKDDVKNLGASYDSTKKQWFVPIELALEPFAQWLDGGMPACGAQYTANCDRTGTSLNMGGGWWHKFRHGDEHTFDAERGHLCGLDDLCDAEYQDLSSAQQSWYVEVACADDLADDLSWYTHGDQYKNQTTGCWAHCWHCGGHLVAIGHARRGGADHPDWEWRGYHKKCWRELYG